MMSVCVIKGYDRANAGFVSRKFGCLIGIKVLIQTHKIATNIKEGFACSDLASFIMFVTATDCEFDWFTILGTFSASSHVIAF